MNTSRCSVNSRMHQWSRLSLSAGFDGNMHATFVGFAVFPFVWASFSSHRTIQLFGPIAEISVIISQLVTCCLEAVFVSGDTQGWIIPEIICILEVHELVENRRPLSIFSDDTISLIPSTSNWLNWSFYFSASLGLWVPNIVTCMAFSESVHNICCIEFSGIIANSCAFASNDLAKCGHSIPKVVSVKNISWKMDKLILLVICGFVFMELGPHAITELISVLIFIVSIMASLETFDVR